MLFCLHDMGIRYGGSRVIYDSAIGEYYLLKSVLIS